MSSPTETKEVARRKSDTPSNSKRSSDAPGSGREAKRSATSSDSGSGSKKVLNEIKGISKFIEEDRGEKGRAIIAVVPPGNLEELERRLHSGRWKFWRSKGLVRLTSTDQLQESINAIQHKPNQHLTLLASRDVDEVLEFHVPASFRALSVHRCYHEQDREGRLLLSGASTFKTTRLDEWQGKKHTKHAIYLGEGVGIKVEMTAEGNPWSLVQCAQRLSEEDMAEVKRNLSLICEPCGPGEIWWKKIMGPTAAILSLLTGRGGKVPGAFTATAAGLNVEYHLGTAALTVATAGVKSHTLYAAAGPAAMLGFGAAMVAYVIPWDSVFMWLKGVFARLYQGFLSMWRSIFAWISEKIFGQIPAQKSSPPSSAANKSAAMLRRTQSSRR